MATLSFAVPTWNRANELRQCLTELCRQTENRDGFEVVVYDNASTDETPKVCDEFANRYSHFSFRRGKQYFDFQDSFANAFAMPKTEWTWMFGDDDLLVDGAVDVALDVIGRFPENVFFHFPEISRSDSSKKLYQGQFMDIACAIGIVDFSGFISGNLIKTDLLQAGLSSRNKAVYDRCAFPQSLIILESCIGKQAGFLDIPLIRLQNVEQKEETVNRWIAYNIMLRYNYLVDGLEVLRDQGKIPRHMPIEFFRYLGGNLFGKILHTFYQMFQRDHVTPRDYDWERLLAMADFIDDKHRALMKEAITLYRGTMKSYQENLESQERIIKELDAAFLMAIPDTYPFNYV